MTKFSEDLFRALPEEEQTALILKYGSMENWVEQHKRTLAYGELFETLKSKGLMDMKVEIPVKGVWD